MMTSSPTHLGSPRLRAAQSRSSTLFRRATTLAAALAGFATLNAGTFSSNFASDPGGSILGKAKVDGGSLKLVDLQDLIDGTSGLPIFGSYVFQDIDAGVYREMVAGCDRAMRAK